MKPSHKIPAFKFLVAAFAFLILSAPSIVAAGGGHGLFSMKALEQLDLTEEQRTKLDALRSEARQNYKSAREEMRALRTELREKLKSDASDDELRRLYSSIQDKRAAKREHKFNRMLEVRSILTPAQREKLMEMGKDHHRRHGKCQWSEEEAGEE